MRFSIRRPSGQLLGLIVLLPLACGLQEHPRDPVAPVYQPGTGGTTPAGSGGTGGSTPSGTGGSNTGGAPPPASDGGVVTAPKDGSSTSPVDAPAGPPPEGPIIDIAGNKVPRNRAIVFIHFGHSNMAGLAQSPSSMRPYFFNTGDRLWSYQGGGRFVPAKEPTAPDPPVHLGAGPGMAWLRAAAAAAGPDYHFISVSRARGGSPTNDFMKGGLYYSDFMDKAIELKGKVTFGGVFIMLGITDRHLPPAQQDGLTDRMVKIVSDIRADLGEPNLPVLSPSSTPTTRSRPPAAWPSPSRSG